MLTFAKIISKDMTKEYKGYLITSEGVVTRNNKTVKSDNLYINGKFEIVNDIVNKLFKAVTKEINNNKVANKPTKLQHGNKGRIMANNVKDKISKANSKEIIFEGVKYNSITECSKLLGVDRTTIYRRLKSKKAHNRE